MLHLPPRLRVVSAVSRVAPFALRRLKMSCVAHLGAVSVELARGVDFDAAGFEHLILAYLTRAATYSLLEYRVSRSAARACRFSFSIRPSAWVREQSGARAL